MPSMPAASSLGHSSVPTGVPSAGMPSTSINCSGLGDVKVKQESVLGNHTSAFGNMCSPSPALMTPPMTPGLKGGYDNVMKGYDNNPPAPHPMLGGFQVPSNPYPYTKHLLS